MNTFNRGHKDSANYKSTVLVCSIHGTKFFFDVSAYILNAICFKIKLFKVLEILFTISFICNICNIFSFWYKSQKYWIAPIVRFSCNEM